MSNGNSTRIVDILRRAKEAGQLDQAPTALQETLQEVPQEKPQEKPQEEPTRQELVVQILRRAAARPDISKPSESRLAGLAKGFVGGITVPLTLAGLDIELPPSRIGPFTREPAGRSRLIGNMAGIIAGAYPFFRGAGLALRAAGAGRTTGLASALTETQFVMLRGALGFGTFEAASAEELKDVPERFIFGATLGAAADLALLKATDAQRLVGLGAIGGGGAGVLSSPEREGALERFAIGATIGGLGALGLIRGLRGKSVSQLSEYISPRTDPQLLLTGGRGTRPVTRRPQTPVSEARRPPSAEVQQLPAALRADPQRLLTTTRAVEEFVATGKPLRQGPFYVTPTGVVFDAGTMAPLARRGVELADNTFLPSEIGLTGLQVNPERTVTAISEATLGSGEAFLYTGEAQTPGGRVLLTSMAADDISRGRLVGPEGASPESVVDPASTAIRYGTRELPNDFEFPITRAEGKPVRYDPETGEAVIRFAPPEKEAFARAFETTGLSQEFLDTPGDFAITESEGRVVRSVLTRALTAKFEETEALAELNEVAGVAQAIDEFQALQLALSKFDVFRPPAEAMIEDLKAIRLIESKSAQRRAIKRPKPRDPDAPPVSIGRELQPLAFIDADALALEQSFTGIGEDSFGDAVQILANVGKSVDEQLEITVAKLSLALNNGGMSLSGIDPAGAPRIVREIRRQFPEVRLRTYKRDVDESWLLVVGDEVVGARALIKETLVKEKRALVVESVKDGTVSDWERFVEVIEADVVGEIAAPPVLRDIADPSLLGQFLAERPVFSTRSTELGPAIISVDPTADAFQKMRTLIHEYEHNLSAAEVAGDRNAMDLGFLSGQAQPGTSRAIFKDFEASVSEAEWRDVFGVRPADNWNELSEIAKLAAWSEASTGIEARRGIVASIGKAKKKGLTKILLNDEYFFADEELRARAMDVVFTNRPAAKALAPTVTKLMLKRVAKNSPKMQLLLQDKRLAKVDEILNEVAFNEVVELQTRVRQFGLLKSTPTDAELNQFAAEGIFPGLLIHKAGVWSDTMIALRREGPDLIVRERWSLPEHTIPWTRIQSTDVLPSKALTDDAIGFVRNGMENVQSVQVPLKIPGGRVALTRVDLRGIKVIEDVDALRADLIKLQPKRADDIAFMPDDELFELAGALSDVEGTANPVQAIRHDNGLTLIFKKPLPEPSLPAQILPEGALETAGEVGGRVVHLTPRQLVESTLQDGGLNARDRAFVADQVLADITKDFTLGLPKELFSYPEIVERLGRTFGSTDVDQTVTGLRRMGLNPDKRNVEAFLHSNGLRSRARQSGYRVRESVDGKFVIETDDGLVVGVFSRAQAEEWISRAGRKRHELSGLSPESLETDLVLELGSLKRIGTSGASYDVPPSGPGKGPARPTGDHSGFAGGGGSEPPRFGETFGSNVPPQRGWADRFVSGLDLLAPFMTGMETESLSIQRAFGVAANTKLFEPLQRAVRTIDRVYNVPRPGMGGRTWNNQLGILEKLSFKISAPLDRENVTIWVEALSKEEVASGLMTRPMNKFELSISKEIDRLGLAHEMPRLISTWRMMKNLTVSRKKFMKRFRSMSQQELSPEMVQRLEVLARLAKSKKEFDFPALAAELNLNEAQARIIQVLEALNQENLSPSVFSLFSVVKHASAESLPKGAKSMQDVIAKRLGLTEIQLALGREMETLYRESFKASGIDSKRYLRGYFPHIRLFAREGLLPNDPIMRDLFPKASAFTAAKFRTGELDIYSKEPLSTAVRHLRGMLMREHFDPVLPEALATLRELKKVDPRSYRIMREYVSELQGKSHDTFRQLQEAFEASGKAMGLDVDRDLAKTLISTLASLSYQALIPFRPALIVRNYFEMVTKIPPRVGGANFTEGLRIALTKDGFEAARRAGAVTENVAPVISGESILGFDQTFRLSRRLQMVSNVGFRWYQKADDLGRATAHHGQRAMTGKAIDKYLRGVYGKDKVKAVQKMLEEGGVKQFDPIHQKQFEMLFRAGKYEDAKDLLGVLLSRQTLNRYGFANHPAGWGSVYGRLFGQFGTWSIQYKDFLIQGATRGTAKDKARFFLWHTTANLGMLAGGAMIGYDLWAWVTFPALLYTGGPYADIAIDMSRLVGGNERERGMAWRSLKFQFVPTLNDPRAIWLPGSYAVGDLAKLWSGEGGFDEALGFRRYEGNEVLDALGFED